MDLFGSEKRINTLHTFFNEFDINKESQIIHNRSINICTAQLLAIKQNNAKHTHSNLKSIAIPQSNNHRSNNNTKYDYYVPPRKGIDHTLDLYFKSNNLNRMNIIGIKKYIPNAEIIVCEICAGYHHKDKCKSIYFVCHMCGGKGHRMFECERAKCFQCLKLGHIAQHCPFRK